MTGSGEGPGALPGVRGAHWPGERGPAPPLFIVCLPAEQKLERPGFLGDRPPPPLLGLLLGAGLSPARPSWLLWPGVSRSGLPPAPMGGPSPRPPLLDFFRQDGRTGEKAIWKSRWKFAARSARPGSAGNPPGGVWRLAGWKGGRSPPPDGLEGRPAPTRGPRPRRLQREVRFPPGRDREGEAAGGETGLPAWVRPGRRNPVGSLGDPFLQLGAV